MTDKKHIIVTEHDIYDHYNKLYQFLGQFALDADFDKFNEVETIKEYNEPCERDHQEYLKILSQANEVLAMEPFPREAVSWAAGGLSRDPEEVKQWLRNALHLLELRVTGKI